VIIGSCGFGGTGSSVLTDLLREYDDVQVFDDFEFSLAYRVDGLQDLEYHLVKQYARNSSSDYAIKRFLDMSRCYETPLINKPCPGGIFRRLSQDFIDEIVQLCYRGVDTADMLTGNVARNVLAFASKKVFIPKLVEKLTRQPAYLWPCRTMYFSIEPDGFYDEARRYINRILEAMGADLARPICLDQPFEGNAPGQSMVFFEDSRAVVIDKDPRDLYLDYKYSMHRDYKFFPRGSVEDFVVFYKNLRRFAQEREDVMQLRFEEFVYEYEATVARVESFLGLTEHVSPRRFFRPEMSINNTQQIRRHPEDSADIKYIENNLREFLFDFGRYPEVQFSANVFFGAEREGRRPR
jgi:hypothetical protein